MYIRLLPVPLRTQRCFFPPVRYSWVMSEPNLTTPPDATRSADVRLTIATTALLVFALDQLTKLAVLNLLGYAQEYVVLDGFFKFVHWGNTGAAWSLFNHLHGSNELLAVVSLLTLLLLLFSRNQFDTRTFPGRLAIGLVVGGIVGNLVDRLHPERQHVVDFIYFYAYRRSGEEIGFPAFNVADSAICVAVALMIFNLVQAERHDRMLAAAKPISPTSEPPSVANP